MTPRLADLLSLVLCAAALAAVGAPVLVLWWGLW